MRVPGVATLDRLLGDHADGSADAAGSEWSLRPAAVTAQTTWCGPHQIGLAPEPDHARQLQGDMHGKALVRVLEVAADELDRMLEVATERVAVHVRGLR